MKSNNGESEHRKKNRDSVLILAEGIGTRISSACALIGSRKEAANVAGVSSDSLQRYIREEIRPPFEAMAKLAYAAGKSLDWLATGQGEQTPGATLQATDTPAEAPLQSGPWSAIQGPLLNLAVSIIRNNNSELREIELDLLIDDLVAMYNAAITVPENHRRAVMERYVNRKSQLMIQQSISQIKSFAQSSPEMSNQADAYRKHLTDRLNSLIKEEKRL